jgi:dihydrofolate reductase
MRINLIAALTDDGVIGLDNGLPWHLPADLKRFKKLTIGKPVLMGRKTWDSIGKPLPDRTNIVVSRDENFVAEGAVVAPSIVEALAEVEGAEEIFVIGGSELYGQLMPCADRMYLTYVHADVAGDARFPPFNPEEWTEKTRKEVSADESNQYPYTFVRLDRSRKERKGNAA